MERDEIIARFNSAVDARIQAITHIDPEKMSVNSHPFYIGRLMLLSDQDATALKHHVLSSAVMGTVFVGLIATISNPEIPLLGRIVLTGSILTGMQAMLVAITNLFTSAVELWNGAGRPVPTARVCIVCVGRFCVAISRHGVRLFSRAAHGVWAAYLAGHTVHLDNGVTVWVDAYGSVVIDDGEASSEASSEASTL